MFRELAVIKPPLSQCLIPDPGRMDVGDQDLKTDNLLHNDICSADLLERESAMSFHSRRRSRPSAQTTHRPRGGTCRERTQPRIAQMRKLVHWHLKRAGQVRQPPLVAIELPGPDPPMGQLARGVIALVPGIMRLFRAFSSSNPPESPSQEESSLASMPDTLEARCRSDGPPAGPRSIDPLPGSRSFLTVSAVA